MASHKGTPEKSPNGKADEGTKIKEAKPRRKKTGVKYIGGGAFVSGVPMNDMSMEEWGLVPKDKQDAALRLNLYEYIN